MSRGSSTSNVSSAFIDHWFALNRDATNSLSAIFFFFFLLSNDLYGYPSLAAHWVTSYSSPVRTAIKLLRVLCSLCFRYSSLARLTPVARSWRIRFITRRQSCHTSRNLWLPLYLNTISKWLMQSNFVKTVMREYLGNYSTRRKVLLDYSLSCKNQRIDTCAI